MQERVAVSNKREAELLANDLVNFGQTARATAEIRQVYGTVSIKSKKSENIAQFKLLMKNLKENVALYEASEECLNGELAKATAESTGLADLFGSTRTQVADLREKWAAKDTVIRSVV